MECSLCHKYVVTLFCSSCAQKSLTAERSKVITSRHRIARLLRDARESAEESARNAQAKRLVDNVRENIAVLRQRVATVREENESSKARLKQRADRLSRRKAELEVARQKLRDELGMMLGPKGIAGAMLHGLNMQLEDSLETLSLVRKKLIMQLVEIFPLESSGPGSKSKETIAGLWLPSTLSQLQAMNSDARKAAISILVQMLLVASAYLSLKMPMHMEFVGTDAVISNPLHGSNKFKITGNTTGPEFEIAIDMLRQNIEALSLYQGVPLKFVKESSLVHGMWQLVHSPSLGNSVQQSLLEADARVGRVPAGRSLRLEVMHQTPVPIHSSLLEQEPSAQTMATPSATGDDSKLVERPSEILDVDLLDDEEDESGGEEWVPLVRPQPPNPCAEDEDFQNWFSSGANL